MSASSKSRTYCVGSPSFDPSELLQNLEKQAQARGFLVHHDLYNATRVMFDLPDPDNFVYHATASVKLAQVQHVVNLGSANSLHAWYRNEDGSEKDVPPQSDIEAYLSIFSPATATTSALKNLGTNARKASIRAEVAAHLVRKRYIHPVSAAGLTIPKAKKPPSNPYFDFWAWSCRSLEWCGPCESAEKVTTSHYVLPILMHHFGCATPSHEALEILKIVSDGRDIVDMGSGNGYWTCMLRSYGLTVHPVDSMQSEWRVRWVDDTTVADGIKWLKKKQHGKDLVLLIVYPVVGGGGEGAFTKGLIEAYHGDTIAVVGTQNRNGYTGFKAMTMDEYMETDHKHWVKVVQIPLPSFAGKDEALYVYQKGERVAHLTAAPAT